MQHKWDWITLLPHVISSRLSVRCEVQRKNGEIGHADVRSTVYLLECKQIASRHGYMNKPSSWGRQRHSCRAATYYCCQLHASTCESSRASTLRREFLENSPEEKCHALTLDLLIRGVLPSGIHLTYDQRFPRLALDHALRVLDALLHQLEV